jgi:hypothetical protein
MACSILNRGKHIDNYFDEEPVFGVTFVFFDEAYQLLFLRYEQINK